MYTLYRKGENRLLCEYKPGPEGYLLDKVANHYSLVCSMYEMPYQHKMLRYLLTLFIF